MRSQPDRSAPSVENALARKLALFVPLSRSDYDFIDTLTTVTESVCPDVDLTKEGAAPRAVFVLMEGMAIRYRNLPDGNRQIMTILVPGDLCNPHIFLLRTMDHSIASVVPTRVAPIQTATLLTLFKTRPRISAALWWSSLQEEAMLRERIVALGRRDARGRVAYLLCETFFRLQSIGLTQQNTFDLPLTQHEIADILGLTPVHVNRVLHRLRNARLISQQGKRLTVLNLSGLQQVADFTSEYLHIRSTTSRVEKYFDDLEADQGR